MDSSKQATNDRASIFLGNTKCECCECNDSTLFCLNVTTAGSPSTITICKHWQRTGECIYKDNCKFLHPPFTGNGETANGTNTLKPKIKKRNVVISLFEINAANFPIIDFRIICSKGTYIRSIVRDFGERANSGAYMSALCRTRIGAFELKDAADLTDFIYKKRLELQLSVDE